MCKTVLNKDILICYITSTDQVVDVFTKGLTSTRFLFLLDHAMSLKGVINQSQTSEIEEASLDKEQKIDCDDLQLPYSTKGK